MAGVDNPDVPSDNHGIELRAIGDDVADFDTHLTTWSSIAEMLAQMQRPDARRHLHAEGQYRFEAVLPVELHVENANVECPAGSLVARSENGDGHAEEELGYGFFHHEMAIAMWRCSGISSNSYFTRFGL